jgi:hypothetical protein
VCHRWSSRRPNSPMLVVDRILCLGTERRLQFTDLSICDHGRPIFFVFLGRLLPAVQKAALHPGPREPLLYWFIMPAKIFRGQCGLPRGRSTSRASARSRNVS